MVCTRRSLQFFAHLGTRLEAALPSHPDGAFVSYLLRGMTWGFQIGVYRHTQRCKPCQKNMMSAKQYPQVVEEYLTEELEAARESGWSVGSAEVRFGAVAHPSGFIEWHLVIAAGTSAISRCYYLG